MAPFRFRLQSVLQHNRQIEDDRKLELAEIEAERTEMELRLIALDLERERVRSAIKAAMYGNVDVDAVARGLRHSEWLDARRLETLAALEALNGRIEAKRQEVVEAMRDRKALEQLRDRDLALYDAEQAHAEQTLLDEMGTSRHHQKSSAPAQTAAAGQ